MAPGTSRAVLINFEIIVMTLLIEKAYRIGGAITLCLLAAGVPFSSVVAQDSRDAIELGEQLVATNCSRCHAVARSGTSVHPEAPPFRTRGRRYNIHSFAEALVEGFSTGHPDMPEFFFEPEEAEAIISYLKSIQSR